MKNLVVILVILVIVLVGIYFFGFSTNTAVAPTETTFQNYAPAPDNTENAMPAMQNTSPSVQANASVEINQSATAPSAITIHIKNFAFSPASITVKAGTKITWVNDDGAPHTVTSDSGNTLDSARLSTGQSYTVTVSKTGTFNYHCAVHPMMKGSVTVN